MIAATADVHGFKVISRNAKDMNALTADANAVAGRCLPGKGQ